MSRINTRPRCPEHPDHMMVLDRTCPAEWDLKGWHFRYYCARCTHLDVALWCSKEMLPPEETELLQGLGTKTIPGR